MDAKNKIENLEGSPIMYLGIVLTARMKSLNIDEKFFPPIMTESIKSIDKIIQKYETSENNSKSSMANRVQSIKKACTKN